jgi:phage shock protein A
MAMKIGLFSGLAVFALIAGGLLYATGPGFRTGVNQQINDWIGWTEAARQADPVGFARHVERTLQRDLDKLQKTRQDLDGEIGVLSRKRREQQALADQAATLAEEFRQAYQTAAASNAFPVTVRHAAYTQEQVESQVSLLLAEAEGYRDAVARLDDVRGQAETRLEALTVQINTTQTQLAALPTQRELLRARVLSDEGEQLVAHVDRLLDVNNRVIQGNPVRGVAELIAAPTPTAELRSNLTAARAYLASTAEVAVSTHSAK